MFCSWLSYLRCKLKRRVSAERRSSLKNKSGERMKNIESASGHEQREKQQVCARMFGSGVGASWLHSTKSFSLWFYPTEAFFISDLSVVRKVSAAQVISISGFFIGPVVQKAAGVELGSVREDKVVVGRAGTYFSILGGDPEKYFAFCVFFA